MKKNSDTTMTFQNVREFIDFLLESPIALIDQYLQKIAVDKGSLDFEEHDSPIEKSLLVSLHNKLEGTQFERDIWEAILFRYKAALPEEIAQNLIEQKWEDIISHLGHVRQHDAIQQMLVDHNDEAMIILGIELYCSKEKTPLAFETFLDEHPDNFSLLEQLARKTPSSEQKYNIYLKYLKTHEDGKDILDFINKTEIAKKLSTTDDIQLIVQEYQKRDPLILRAITINPNTPIQILKELSHIKGVKYAKEMRYYSRRTLDKIKRRAS